MLPVAVVLGLVAPAVAKIDATHEGDVTFRTCRMADDHELLVM
jgi:hypothetical protein